MNSDIVVAFETVNTIDVLGITGADRDLAITVLLDQGYWDSKARAYLQSQLRRAA
jgi:hypothetical protein